MSRNGPTLVYVHGAGTQPPEADWVRIHNLILFSDRPAPATDLGYYADLMHRVDDGTAGLPGAETPGPIVPDPPSVPEPAGTDLAERDAAQRALGDSIHGSVAGEGRIHEAHLLLLRLAAAMGPADHRSRFALPGNVIPLAVRDFYRELSGYLHGTPGIADAMRDRVRDAIGRNEGPLVVLAHSLGSIIAFDVLSEPDLAGRDVHFVTVGSPLALGPVQDHLRAWRGSRPIEVPAGVATWRNFHAGGDPVASGSALEGLRNDFAPSLRIHSTEVRNDAEWHHALNGYLETPEVRDAIHGRLWWWSG
ncbi:MAG: hypothetical protein ACYDAN_13765 [Candidatus Limnocylindrales bacterium]